MARGGVEGKNEGERERGDGSKVVVEEIARTGPYLAGSRE